LTSIDVKHLRPILVTGMPRAGTTWVARILAESGEIGYIDEPFNLSTTPGSIRVPVHSRFEYVSLENEIGILPVLGPMLAFEYPLVRELRRCRSRDDLRHTFKCWLVCAGNRGRRPVVKDAHAVFSAEWFARRLGADVVVLVRHPLSVVGSWRRLGWDFQFSDLLEQPLLMRDWLAPFKSQMSAADSESWSLVERVALFWRVIYSVVTDDRFPRVHLLRHEDLSADPVGEFAKLYEVLGLSFTDAVAEAVVASSSSVNPGETKVAMPHAWKLDSRANLENWRQRLNEEEIDKIKRLTEGPAAVIYPDHSWAGSSLQPA
jgi:hypothetical protein